MTAMKIGCDNLVWAPLTADDGTLITYGTPVPFPGLMKIGISPNSSTGTAFFDNGPGDTAATLGAIEVTIDKNALSSNEEALLLGHTIGTNGVVISSGDDVPPEGALGYRTLKSNGKHAYVWLLKGSFSEPEDNSETRGDSVSFQNPTIKGNFSKVTKKYTIGGKVVQPWRTKLDEEDAAATPEAISKFFNAPVLPDTVFTA